MFKVGQAVYWSDPDNDECSQAGVVHEICCDSDDADPEYDIIIVKSTSGTCFEALACELTAR